MGKIWFIPNSFLEYLRQPQDKEGCDSEDERLSSEGNYAVAAARARTALDRTLRGFQCTGARLLRVCAHLARLSSPRHLLVREMTLHIRPICCRSTHCWVPSPLHPSQDSYHHRPCEGWDVCYSPSDGDICPSLRM